jgi:hypothetical protein
MMYSLKTARTLCSEVEQTIGGNFRPNCRQVNSALVLTGFQIIDNENGVCFETEVCKSQNYVKI